MEKRTLRNLAALLMLILLVAEVRSQNRWTTMDTFPVPRRNAPASFTLDTDSDGVADKGYAFGGWDVNQTDYKDLWQFNPVTGTWSQKADLPSYGRRGPTPFVINNIAYIACGAHGTGLPGDFNNEVWAYDNSSNSWTQKGNFPGGPRWGMSSFALNGTGYIVMGDSGSVTTPMITNDVWQYTPSNDSWIQKNTFPGPARRELSTFITLDTDSDNVPDRAYFGYGQSDVSTTYNDFWEYNPVADTWTQKTPLPGTPNGRLLPMGFTIQNRGYFGLGCSGDGVYNYADLYLYDQPTDSWVRMADLDGPGRRDAFVFSIADTGYIGCGYNGTVLNDCHKYTPFLNGYNAIHGKLYVDANSNCAYDTTEQPLKNWVVQAVPGPYFASTDSNGNYSLFVDSGTYTVTQLSISQQGLVSASCPNNYQVSFTGTGTDTSGYDFGDSVQNCPFLTIDVGVASKHRCQDNLDVVHYCNEGFAIARNVDVYVALPTYVNFVSADYPNTVNTNGYLVFHVDSILPGVCNDIHIIDHIDCQHVEYIGLTACVKTWITPANNCGTPPDSTWNNADLEAAAICLGLDSVQLSITNVGTGNMTDSTAYRVYLDQTLVYVGKVLLAAGNAYPLYIQSGGHTVRIEVDEPVGHPFNTTSAAWVEACGSNVPMTVTQGFVSVFPTDPVEPEKAIDCVEIDGAWDPNDKAVSPVGLTSNHYVKPGTLLNYKIRFENTGNAPAQKVVLIDSLSADLDPATIRVVSASHAYTFSVSGSGRPVVKFTYNNINLPDSTTNLLQSQGFAAFSVKPYASTALGTVINNNAGIYFDFNPAVVTNTTITTISNYSDEKLSMVLNGGNLVEGLQEVKVDELGISLFPNPNHGLFMVGFNKGVVGQVDISITDLTSRVLWSKNISDIAPTIMAIDLSTVSKGIYFLNVRSNGISVTKKIAVE